MRLTGWDSLNHYPTYQLWWLPSRQTDRLSLYLSALISLPSTGWLPTAATFFSIDRYYGQAPRFHFQTPPLLLPTFSTHPIRLLILQPAADHSRTLFPECKGPGALYTVMVRRDVRTALGKTARQLFKFNTIWSSCLTPGYLQKKTQNMCPHEACPYIFRGDLFKKTVPSWKEPSCPSHDKLIDCFSHTM